MSDDHVDFSSHHMLELAKKKTNQKRQQWNTTSEPDIRVTEQTLNMNSDIE